MKIQSHSPDKKKQIQASYSQKPATLPRVSLKRMLTSVLLVTFVYAFSGGCAFIEKITNQKPSFTLDRLRITGITLTHLNLQLEGLVENPYPFAIPAGDLDLGLAVEGRELQRMQLDLSDGVPADNSQPIKLDVQLPYSGLIALYRLLPTQETLQCDLTGQLNLHLPEEQVGRIPGLPEKIAFDVNQSRRLPALNPGISIRDFRISGPDPETLRNAIADGSMVERASTYLGRLLEGSAYSPGSAESAGLDDLGLELTGELDLVLTNQAAAALNFVEVDYELLLQNESFLKGISKDIQNNGTESVITIESTLPLASVGAALARAISNRAAAFDLKGRAGFDIPSLPEDGTIHFNFDENGRLSW